jgi:hypothetical protein
MLLYITALTIIAVLLLCAVRLHLSLGLHRVKRARVEIIVPPVEPTPHLHDYIFAKY